MKTERGKHGTEEQNNKNVSLALRQGKNGANHLRGDLRSSVRKINGTHC